MLCCLNGRGNGKGPCRQAGQVDTVRSAPYGPRLISAPFRLWAALLLWLEPAI